MARNRYAGRRALPFSGQPAKQAKPGRGSAFRGGQSIIAVGGPVGTSVADGASGEETYTIAETAVLDRLVLGENDVAAALNVLKISNDPLITGFVPASMFAENSQVNPFFGHIVTPQTTVVVGRRNQSGGALLFESAFATHAVDPSDAVQPKRGLIAIGGADDAVVTAATTTTHSFTITEAGRLGKYVIQLTGTFDINDYLVESIKYDNDELLTGSIPVQMFLSTAVSSPVFGHWVEEAHSLTVVIRNQHATQAPNIAHGFSIL